MSDSGSPFLVPEKTRSQLGVRSSAQRRTIATALLQSGTTCSRLAFIRCLGIVQRRRPRSNSSQVAPLTSPERLAVRIANSRASRLNDSRSEEHTSELQSLMRNSYAVFCLQKQ